MPLINLDGIDDPRLDVYRNVKKTNLTRWSSQFSAEGKKLVAQLLESEYDVESILTSEKYIDILQPHLAGRRADVPIYSLPQSVAQMLVGMKFHAGMLGCGIRKPAPQIEQLVTPSKRHVFVACVHTENPDNIGAIIRIAAGFGATAVLLGPRCSDPFSRRAIRGSMGNALRIPILELGDSLRTTLDWLRSEHNTELFATVLDDNAEVLRNVRPDRDCVLVFGNESEGLSPEWIDLCDRRLTIPMQDGTDSLNVSVACGIFLHHFQTNGSENAHGNS